MTEKLPWPFSIHFWDSPYLQLICCQIRLVSMSAHEAKITALQPWSHLMLHGLINVVKPDEKLLRPDLAECLLFSGPLVYILAKQHLGKSCCSEDECNSKQEFCRIMCWGCLFMPQAQLKMRQCPSPPSTTCVVFEQGVLHVTAEVRLTAESSGCTEQLPCVNVWMWHSASLEKVKFARVTLWINKRLKLQQSM